MSFPDVVAATNGMSDSEIVDFLSSKLAHLHIPYKDIVSSTKNFTDENLIVRGNTSDVYKGKLFRSEKWINVAIRRFRLLSEVWEFKFLREVATLFQLNHCNTVSIVGFCNENGEKMMVFEYEDNGSLDVYISDPNLTWSQRLRICIGVAQALRYIHNDIEGYLRDCFHHDIKSSKILLDEDWEPKLFCFGFHLGGEDFFNTKSSYTEPRYTMTGHGIHKSDTYSFGAMMFEVLLGQEAMSRNGNRAAMVDAARHNYANGTLYRVINPDIWKQINPSSLSIFLKVASNSVKDTQPWTIRMNRAVERLQQALEIHMKHENLDKEYAYLKIPLSDLTLATADFATQYNCSGFYIDGMVYNADLDDSLLTIDGKNKHELPKMRVPVILIRNRGYDHQKEAKWFIAEVEMLAGCKHPNIVSLLGYSWEGYKTILVYEHAINGSLTDYLGSRVENKLTWEQRIHICLDIANGLKYLHANMPVDESYITLQSAHVMLGEKWNAKLTNFRFSTSSSVSRGKNSTYYTSLTNIYFTSQSDIYSLGVILFEILFGRLAYDPIYTRRNYKGLAPIARQHFIKGTLKNLVDPKIMEEARDQDGYKIGPDERSLNTFGRIAYQCLWETESKCPILEGIIYSLNKALSLQLGNLDHLKIQYSEILSATKNFDKSYCIGRGGYGAVYKAELCIFYCGTLLAMEMENEDKRPRKHTVAIHRFLRNEYALGESEFLVELELLYRCENHNIISLLGFCIDASEMILVFEYASNGSLDDYLGNSDKMISLTWSQRLNMCLGIAYGLNYLHTEGDEKGMVHRNINSGNILLGENLEVKIAIGASAFYPTNHPTSNLVGPYCYFEPEHSRTGKMKVESDIYSFGVVLFEILSGKLANDPIYNLENEKGIAPVAQWHFKEGNLMEMVDSKMMTEAHELSSTIKKGPNQDSLNAYFEVACKCLAKSQAGRPKMEEVINGLKRALDFQHSGVCIQELSSSLKRFSLGEIKRATNDFGGQNLLGEGGFGKVFLGRISENRYDGLVAVKQLKIGSTQGTEEFHKEIDLLSDCHHANIISLLGCCIEGSEKILVYEYMEKGSLYDYLYKDREHTPRLTIEQRLKICIGVASGLGFLHSGSQFNIIHSDLKTDNILLDANLVPKIADFGLSRTRVAGPSGSELVTNHIKGTDGYLAPECYEANYKLSRKADVYAFGIVLLEVLCERPPWKRLLIMALPYIMRGELQKSIPAYVKDSISRNCLKACEDLIRDCLDNDPHKRPSMNQVMDSLTLALELQNQEE